jgi:hypothetical protein
MAVVKILGGYLEVEGGLGIWGGPPLYPDQGLPPAQGRPPSGGGTPPGYWGGGPHPMPPIYITSPGTPGGPPGWAVQLPVFPWSPSHPIAPLPGHPEHPIPPSPEHPWVPPAGGTPVPPDVTAPLPPPVGYEDQMVIAVYMPGQPWKAQSYTVAPDQGPQPAPVG